MEHIERALGFLCSLICLFPSLAALVMLSRWSTGQEVERLRSRLEAWATERGDTIVRLERPDRGPVGCAGLVSGPPRWLILARDAPWEYRQAPGPPFGTWTPSYSTRVILRDRSGRLRQGRMQYVGRFLGGFRGQVESRWEDEGPPPSPLPPPPPADPREDPLWDRWIDPSGVG